MVCSGVIIINRGAIVAQGPIDTLVQQFFPTARVEVEIVGPADAVRQGLARIPGVTAVAETSAADGACAFRVESPRDRDVRGEIFQLAAQQRWGLRELRRVGITLEEVFMGIVAGEEAASADYERAREAPVADEPATPVTADRTGERLA
jgi:ABC-2 type transport system ATP-binding protein